MDADLRAEIHLSSPSLPLVGLAAAIPDARIDLEELLRTGTDRAVYLCWIEAQPFDAVEAALDAEPSIAAWSLLEAVGGRRLYRLPATESTAGLVPIESAFVERGTTPIDATITAEGWHLRARFPDRATLAAYRESCRERGLSFVLERLYRATGTGGGVGLTLAGLTPKQREALLLAHEFGYYELPRRTDLADLGERLGISRRSLSDRLRRAERTLVESAVANDRAGR